MLNKCLSGWKMLINYEDTNKIQIEFPQNGKFPRSGMHIPYPPAPSPSLEKKKRKPPHVPSRTHTQTHTHTHTHIHKYTHTSTHTNTDYPNTDHQHGRCQFPCYWLRLGLLWCFEG